MASASRVSLSIAWWFASSLDSSSWLSSKRVSAFCTRQASRTQAWKIAARVPMGPGRMVSISLAIRTSENFLSNEFRTNETNGLSDLPTARWLKTSSLSLKSKELPLSSWSSNSITNFTRKAWNSKVSKDKSFSPNLSIKGFLIVSGKVA